MQSHPITGIVAEALKTQQGQVQLAWHWFNWTLVEYFKECINKDFANYSGHRVWDYAYAPEVCDTLSRPIPSRPIPSHPIPSHPISSHSIPSHPIASHRFPLSLFAFRFPSHPTPPHPIPDACIAGVGDGRCAGQAHDPTIPAADEALIEPGSDDAGIRD